MKSQVAKTTKKGTVTNFNSAPAEITPKKQTTKTQKVVSSTGQLIELTETDDARRVRFAFIAKYIKAYRMTHRKFSMNLRKKANSLYIKVAKTVSKTDEHNTELVNNLNKIISGIFPQQSA